MDPKQQQPDAVASLDAADGGMTPEVLRALVENHAAFLGFLEKRVGSRDRAEEILQEAFVRGIDRGGSLRDGESATAWFYRLLRNAVVDHYRHRGAEKRALESVAAEPEPASTLPDEALTSAVCACVGRLVETLKPEYGAALRRVDLDGESVLAYAAEAGITANNAGVRLFRAREALRQRLAESCGTCAAHGCMDCSCGAPAGAHV